jgi:hypothetical protein
MDNQSNRWHKEAKCMKIKFFRHRNTMDNTVTTQAVVYGDNGLVMADATIKLHPNDRDDRRVARKISLTYALRNVPSKALRSQVWDAFWEEFGQ